MRLFPKFSIDLGTANTLIYDLEEIVLQEPTVVALDSYTEQVIALGEDAEQLRGRSSDRVTVRRPLKDGVIFSQEAAEMMLSHFITRILGKWHFFAPRLIVGVPSGATELERRAVREVVTRAGAKLVYLIDEPIAAAIGAGLPITDPVGNMVLDIGGGTSEVAVLSMAGPIFSESIKIAGNELTETIQRYLKHTYQLTIGFREAEKIKHQIGSVHQDADVDETKMEVAGINLISGLPANVTVQGYELRQILTEQTTVILELVRSALERLEPELAADLAEYGITLVGGGALLKGLDCLISDEFKILVNIPPEPLKCVIFGAGEAMVNPGKYRPFLQKVV